MYYVKDNENRTVTECETVGDVKDVLDKFYLEMPLAYDEMPFTIKDESTLKEVKPSELGILNVDEE